jgi:outer membrane lipoprotein LolB
VPIARRKLLVGGSIFAINFIAACAHKTSGTGLNDLNFSLSTGPWAGRISLKIQSDPPQAFFAGFELKGQADAGELTLTNPLGGTIGTIRWSPTSATLESQQGPKRFASLGELLAQAIGAAIPIAALFDWLAGKQTNVAGWTADLSQQAEGRIQAVRVSPEPQAQLRLILDRQVDANP